jgi:hypothetical protein
MVTDTTVHVDAPRPVAQTTPADAPADTAAFRKLLESFERIAKEHRAAAPLACADDVAAAMARADEGYSLAMDLRQQLEAAFRARM